MQARFRKAAANAGRFNQKRIKISFGVKNIRACKMRIYSQSKKASVDLDILDNFPTLGFVHFCLLVSDAKDKKSEIL